MLELVLLIVLFAALGFAWRRFWRWCEAYNQTDWGHQWLNRLDGLNRQFCRYYHGLQYEPLQIPPSGPAIVVANHISGLDPLLLLASCQRPLHFMVAREQYDRFGLQWLFRWVECIPVDRKGRADKAMREAIAALEAGKVVAIFPHGSIHLPRDPHKKLKGGAVRLALKTGAPLVPAKVEDVKLQGFTLPAVVIPSQARVSALPVQRCADKTYEECLEILEKLVNYPVQ
jgi:1-acyl-sn-glycerol-3-phosphate acyltransferase